MTGSSSAARQRAGSFARRSSWQLDPSQMNEITFLSKTNVNQMATYHLPIGLLSTSPGDLTPLNELAKELHQLQSRTTVDSSIQSAWKGIYNRISTTLHALHNSPVITTQVPFDIVEEMLGASKTVAEKAKDSDDRISRTQTKIKQLQDKVAENDRLLEEFRKAPRFTQDILPSSILGVDGFRQGWQDEWWASGQRQRTLEALEHTWDQWARDDDRDQLGVSNREWLKDVVGAIKLELQVFDAVQKLRTVPPPLSQENAHQFVVLLAESQSRRDESRKDLQTVGKLKQDLEKRDKEAKAAFAKSCDYLYHFTADTDRRIQQAEKDIQDLQRWKSDEHTRIQDMAKPSSPKINALRAEIDGLKHRLKIAEEELNREVDLWLKEAQPDNREKMAQLAKEMEDKYQADQARLLAIKDLLIEEHNRCFTESNKREVMEEERQRELRRIFGLLDERHEVLSRTAQMFDDLVTVTELAQQTWTDLYHAVDSSLDMRFMETQPKLFSLRLEGLEIGGKLCTVASLLETNIKERLSVADTTLGHLNVLLEFNVDTYDPYAHRFSDIRNDIIAMRHRLRESLAENAETFRFLKEEVLPLKRGLIAHDLHGQARLALEKLNKQYPTMFDIAKLDKASEPPAGVIIPGPTPRSRYVTALRREASSPSFSSSALSSPSTPHSPLPWVESRRWQMPGDERSFNPADHSSVLSTSWSRSKKGTFGSNVADFAPTSPTRFDHREFALSKLLK